MLLTGTRVSEACGLKWDAVDLEKSMVRIVRRVSWDKINKIPSLDNVTKTTNSARLLILPKRLQALLSEMKKEAQSDLVFTDSKGELLRYNAIQMETKNLSAVQASLGHTEQKTTQVYAKTVALLSSETGEKTASVIFKDSQF